MDKIKELEKMAKQAIKDAKIDFNDIIDRTSDSCIDTIKEYGDGLGFAKRELYYNGRSMDLEVEYTATFDGEEIVPRSYTAIFYVYTTDEEQAAGLDEFLEYEVEL